MLDRRLMIAIAALSALSACGGNGGGDDAGMEAPDAGPTCGNLVVEAGEDCDDGNSVAFDGCEPTCQFTCDAEDDCDDGDACNGAESCNADHYCEGGAQAADGTPCSLNPAAEGVCSAGECAVSCATVADCDDQDVCTGIEMCSDAHLCVLAEPALDCDDGNDCTADACDPSLGCSSTLIDEDADGHASDMIGLCGDDCDDGNPVVYRNAVELCDGFDNNCDERIDEEAPSWFVDCDGDGYSASEVGSIPSCNRPSAPTGCTGTGATWTDVRPIGAGLDCSDTDPSRNPGTYELCDPSNVDQDCDGAAFDGCPSSLTLGATTWLTTIGDPNFNFFDGCGGAGPTAVIVGFNVAAGTLVDSVQAVCKTTQLAQSSGSPEYQYSVQTTGAEVLTGRFGGGGGTTVALRCNPNEVVVTVDAFADSNQIYRFGIWCAPISFVRSGSSWVATTGTPRAGGAWGNASGPYVSYQCPDGGAVNNMLGTAGAYLNGFQSICQQMSYVPR